MIKEPDLYPGAGIRIGEVDFSALLKESRCHLPRVRDHTMHNFQAIAIRFVLEVSTDGVESWRGQDSQRCQDEDQHRQRRPIFDAANAPTYSPATNHPDGNPVSHVEQS